MTPALMSSGFTPVFHVSSVEWKCGCGCGCASSGACVAACCAPVRPTIATATRPRSAADHAAFFPIVTKHLSDSMPARAGELLLLRRRFLGCRFGGCLRLLGGFFLCV